MKKVASSYKIVSHWNKIAAYLAGEPISPVTVELDITSECSRSCPDCPSIRSAKSLHLDIDFVDRLLGVLEGQTRGLLLTGGEPTMSPIFSKVLKTARKRNFADVAVVTNGSFLDRENVVGELLENASVVRMSLYDWGKESCAKPVQTLEKIEALRNRIEAQSSDLKIGVSVLTDRYNADGLIDAAEIVRTAGAHWVYFHPVCKNWLEGDLKQTPQDGVLEVVQQYGAGLNGDFGVHILPERYSNDEIRFEGYHAAHFLLVVGADGKNYLGAEVKYQPLYSIADFKVGMEEDFLRRSDRIERIRSVSSRNYTALGSRHRGVLYNDVIEKLKLSRLNPDELESTYPIGEFEFPHIL